MNLAVGQYLSLHEEPSWFTLLIGRVKMNFVQVNSHAEKNLYTRYFRFMTWLLLTDTHSENFRQIIS